MKHANTLNNNLTILKHKRKESYRFHQGNIPKIPMLGTLVILQTAMRLFTRVFGSWIYGISRYLTELTTSQTKQESRATISVG